MVMEPGAYEIVPLWTLHAHALDAFGMSPRLGITSPRPGCGKTTLLDILSHLTPRPLVCASLKAPTLFRTIEAAHPTLLIDEMDTFLAGDEELRGIINDGHRRNGRAIRLVGDDNEPRQFSTWAAMAVAKIGEFPETITDRSVKVKLKRKRPDEVVRDFRWDRTETLDTLASKAARWSADHVQRMADMDPPVPGNLHNRASDNWRPLLAIADAAGGEWPKIARDIAAGTVDPEQSSRTKLLADIRDVFAASGHAQLPSAKVVGELIAMEGRPWAEWHHGKAITVNGLAKLLATDGISPSSIRFEGGTPKGYKLAQFADAFARYLPDTPNQTATTPQPAENKGFQAHGEAQQANGCGGSGNPANPSVSAPCGVVAFQKGVEREKDAKLPWSTDL
jgi:putative DNA primase/helicase